MMARIALVERLSGINARHISATGRLAGMEIELSGPSCAPAEDAPEAPSGAPVERSDRERLERDRRALERSMVDIDRERDALERDLRDVDERLASLDGATGDVEGDRR